jgi:hypothetical protein
LNGEQAVDDLRRDLDPETLSVCIVQIDDFTEEEDNRCTPEDYVEAVYG